MIPAGPRALAGARAGGGGRGAVHVALLAAWLALACGSSAGQRLSDARALADAGRPAEAIAILRELLERDPDDPDLNFELGLALARTDQTNLAIVYLRKSEASPTLGPQASLELARIYAEGQNYEEAIRAATRTLDREPDNAEALSVRASAAMDVGSHDDALADADRMLAHDPNDATARSLKATALMRLGRLDLAERELAALKELGTHSGNVAFAAASCAGYARFQAEGKKDAVRAEREYDRCTELYPDDPTVVALALPFYDSVERGDKALRVVQRVVEKEPNSIAARRDLARRLADRGEPAAGEATLREAAERLDTQVAWVALTEFLRSQDQAEDALAAIERAIALTPKAIDAFLLVQVDLCLELGRTEAAEAAAARMELPVYRDFAAGRILYSKDDPRGAIAAFDRGLRSWPNNGWARFYAGRAALALGDTDRALEEFVEATRSDPEASDAALLAAEVYLARGDVDRCVEMASRHIQHRKSGHVKAILVGARAEESRDERAVAGSIVAAAVKQFPKDPHLLAFRAGLATLEAGPARAARQLAESGLDFTDPANEPAIRALAELRAAERRPQAALAVADAGLAKHPDSAFFHELRGRVLLRLGRAAEAKASLDRALAIDPDDDAALAALGSLLGRSGEAARGLELLDRAVGLAPDEPDHAFQAALLVRSQGNADDAIARLERILARSPTHAATCNELAWLLASRKQDLPRALELALRAARLAPAPDVLDTLGYVQLASGDAAAAVDSLERSLALRPGAPGSRYRLGVALAASGRPAEAERAFRESLATGAFPEADEARARLAELERSRTTP